MSKRSNARYTAWPTDIMVYPKNPDGSMPSTTSILGGVGPFDFSGVDDISAVAIYSKIDSGSTESDTVDLSGAADQSAVTVAELFAAINVTAPTDITASDDSTTGRLKLAYSGSGSPSYVQVWGDAVQLANVGYGNGQRIAYINTQQTFTFAPDRKDDETITLPTLSGMTSRLRPGDTARDQPGRSLILLTIGFSALLSTAVLMTPMLRRTKILLPIARTTTSLSSTFTVSTAKAQTWKTRLSATMYPRSGTLTATWVTSLLTGTLLSEPTTGPPRTTRMTTGTMFLTGVSKSTPWKSMKLLISADWPLISA